MQWLENLQGKNRARPTRAELVKYVYQYFFACGYDATSVTIKEKVGPCTIIITFSVDENNPRQ